MNDILSLFDDSFGFDRTPGLYSYHDSRTKSGGKSFHDYDRDGVLIQYVGAKNGKNYALSLKDQYIPISEDADELLNDNQVTGVYSYPISRLNEAFWDQEVDESILRPLWRKDTKAIKSYVESLAAKIAELQKKQKEYQDMLPYEPVDKDATLGGKKEARK